MALDVNEATDDESVPLGAGDAYADIGVLHGNLDEAAACVGRKRELLERYHIRDGLENVLPLAEVEAVARALLGRGCGVVLLTLGPIGAFAATNDAETLKRTLGRIQHGLAPSATSRRAAFKAGGAIDTVGAGDAFLAGAVASLLAGGDLDRVLDVGLAAALWRVDTSRRSTPPRSYRSWNGQIFSRSTAILSRGGTITSPRTEARRGATARIFWRIRCGSKRTLRPTSRRAATCRRARPPQI